MNKIKICLSLFLFLFLITTCFAFKKNPSQILFINQVRGEECCAKGNLDNLKLQVSVFQRYQIPGYFVLRYDTLISKKYVDYLKKFKPPIINLGLMIEVTPQLAKDAGVIYKEKESTWFEAQNAFTIGYHPKDRKKLVDLLFKKFKENFSYYPQLTSAWMIDTPTLNYLVSKYHVRVHQITREQWETDSYTLDGGPPHYPYPASKNWLFVPDYLRLNPALIVRQTVSDPVLNFKDYTSRFTSQPNDYLGDGKDINYFKRLINQVLNQPKNQTGFALLGLENSMDIIFQKEYLKQIDHVNSLKEKHLVAFPTLDSLRSFWRKKPISYYCGKDLVKNSGKTACWITFPFLRLRISSKNYKTTIDDLRIFLTKLIDPYFYQPAVKGGDWVIPAIIKQPVQVNLPIFMIK